MGSVVSRTIQPGNGFGDRVVYDKFIVAGYRENEPKERSRGARQRMPIKSHRLKGAPPLA